MTRGPGGGRPVLAAASSAALALVWAGQAAAFTPEEFRYTRTVEVAAAGTVVVPLDLDALSHMASKGEDLSVFSPRGDELALRLVTAAAGELRRSVLVTAVERHPGGWWIRIDAGPEPLRHHRLLFELSQETLAAGATLDSSPDGSTWRPLARADLFRLGTEEATRRSALDYEPTRDRFLRLGWPEAAGFPEVLRVSVDAVSGRAVEQRVEQPECTAAGALSISCRIGVEALGARWLTAEVRSGGASVGYRLARAEGGHWITRRRGIWRAPAAGSFSRLLAISPARGGTLRLELEGTGALPELAAYRIGYRPLAVVFEAEAPGRHTLAYGAGGRPAAPPPEESREEILAGGRVEPGPEVEHALPPLPTHVTEAVRPRPAAAFAGRWTVRAPGAAVGEVVRLEVPEAVYRRSRPDLADLRLDAAGRQLPFVRRRLDEPRAVVARGRLEPRTDAPARPSRAVLDLPASGLPWTELELTAGEAPFERRLRGTYSSPRRPGLAPEPGGAFGWTLWSCREEGPLSCRLTVPLRQRRGDRLEFEIEDGDNPPLGPLRATIWRRRDLLVFVWPRGGSVELLAGSANLRAPAYDLALLADDLLARPWVRGALEVETASDPDDRLGRLVLLAALVLAAVLLVVFLSRMLRTS